VEILEFIFRLGIIFIVFSLIWGFFNLLFRFAVGLRPLHPVEDYVIKIIHLYILASISAMQTLAFLQDDMPKVAIVVFGILTLFFYLTGRLERNRMTIRMNNRVFSGAVKEPDLRIEMLLIFSGIFYYSLGITNENIVHNNLNHWFFETVNDLYDTPLLKWIFGFFGILFLINIIFRSFVFFNNLLNRLLGNTPKNPDDHGNGSGNNPDNEYTDYEVINDDKT
jgi:hypothetical protein